MNGLKLNLYSFLGLLIYVSIKNLDKVPIFSYLFKGYSFEQITELIQWWNLRSFSYQLSLHLYGLCLLG